ncbi:MAG: hypothetical protein P857_1108 [Candidatus Xenolissoclinum pacificiensis L6]|uniref:Uncharacterized protein n=1 Tax=Candidatus Xenolissoclinum pacificiensis L6 TaxID=1401685 RepID=W2V388_9RICK|nr:MAG: hypothetical protein P857_1108 [Candidatus Xenolissoclinum pacificiensis L6]
MLQSKNLRQRQVARQCSDFISNIKLNKQKIIDILAPYQPQEVTLYEIERSIDTLEKISKDSSYEGSIEKMAVFMPSNLPLYSLLLFAIIPSFMAETEDLRPNSIMQKMVF